MRARNVRHGSVVYKTRAKLEAYAKLNYLEVAEVLAAGASGKTLNRPGLQRALSMLVTQTVREMRSGLPEFLWKSNCSRGGKARK